MVKGQLVMLKAPSPYVSLKAGMMGRVESVWHHIGHQDTVFVRFTNGAPWCLYESSVDDLSDVGRCPEDKGSTD